MVVAWRKFGNVLRKVFESIDRYVPHKILRKYPDPEYYNKEVTRLKANVIRVNKNKLGERYQVELKRLRNC
jgi:hypothetical protein